jgi:asparagine synthase (glutamine-hydrolysing)
LTYLLADRVAPVRPLLDTGAAAQATNGGGAQQDIRPAAELTLGLDTWLRRYDVTLEL